VALKHPIIRIFFYKYFACILFESILLFDLFLLTICDSYSYIQLVVIFKFKRKFFLVRWDFNSEAEADSTD